MSWQCPICNFTNADFILKCVCGFELDTTPLDKPRAQLPQDTSIKNIDFYEVAIEAIIRLPDKSFGLIILDFNRKSSEHIESPFSLFGVLVKLSYPLLRKISQGKFCLVN